MLKKQINNDLIGFRQNGLVIDPSHRGQHEAINSEDSDMEDIPSGAGSPSSEGDDQPKDYSQASTSAIPTTPTATSKSGAGAAGMNPAAMAAAFGSLPTGFPFMPGFFANPLFPNLASQQPEAMQLFVQMQRQMLQNPQMFANMGLQNFQQIQQNLLLQSQQPHRPVSLESSPDEKADIKPQISELMAATINNKKKTKISIDDILNLKTSPKIKIKSEICSSPNINNNNDIKINKENLVNGQNDDNVEEEEDDPADTTEEATTPPPHEISTTDPSNTSSASST